MNRTWDYSTMLDGTTPACLSGRAFTEEISLQHTQSFPIILPLCRLVVIDEIHQLSYIVGL